MGDGGGGGVGGGGVGGGEEEVLGFGGVSVTGLSVCGVNVKGGGGRVKGLLWVGLRKGGFFVSLSWGKNNCKKILCLK